MGETSTTDRQTSGSAFSAVAVAVRSLWLSVRIYVGASVCVDSLHHVECLVLSENAMNRGTIPNNIIESKCVIKKKNTSPRPDSSKLSPNNVYDSIAHTVSTRIRNSAVRIDDTM